MRPFLTDMEVNMAINTKRQVSVIRILALAMLVSCPAMSDELVEPKVFSSHAGTLSLLIIAKPSQIPTISFPAQSGGAVNPTGWVYEICPRPPAGTTCAPGRVVVADYGGARLALQPGDRLEIRFVNRLPKLDPIKVAHAEDEGGANLPLNPSNLHTHGLIVPARAPTATDPTFGDYVFVNVFNPANGLPASQGGHDHGQNAMDFVDYRIDIPRNHPSGLYWFHPHVHGLSLNQVSSGLAGIITIGEVENYTSLIAYSGAASRPQARHLILKDLQLLAAGTVQFEKGPASVANAEILHQQDPDFCQQFPVSGEIRQGSCPGADKSGDGGKNFTGGRWYFTINGQQFPTIPVNAQGELWRLTNASGSLSYRLQLSDDSTKTPMLMQLVAVDGVSINLPQDTPIGSVVHLAGAKFTIVACPKSSTFIRSLPVCVSELVMMPSARGGLGDLSRLGWPGSAGAPEGFGDAQNAGPDDGQRRRLAGCRSREGSLRPRPPPSVGAPSLLSLAGDALKVAEVGGILSAPAPEAQPAPLPAGCRPLPPGHRRRIFFGLEDLTDDSTFGLGYEEVDERGAPIPNTQTAVMRFDPMRPSICLPLGPGQTPVHETWELVQLSTENHNFHIHQTKLRPIEAGARPFSLIAARPASGVGYGILEDNLPLGVASPDRSISDQVMNNQSGVCSIEQWRNGHCRSKTVMLDIPFSKLGDFVYHCHILEHEDGGMMAKIRVVPSPF